MRLAAEELGTASPRRATLRLDGVHIFTEPRAGQVVLTWRAGLAGTPGVDEIRLDFAEPAEAL